jgi:hypothetical protein
VNAKAAVSKSQRGGRSGRSDIRSRGQWPQSCRGAARSLYAGRLRPRWHVRGWLPRRWPRSPWPGRRRPAGHPKILASAACALLLLGAGASAQTLDDLKKDGNGGSTDNILTYGMGYHQQRYSPLKEIGALAYISAARQVGPSKIDEFSCAFSSLSRDREVRSPLLL